jgi:general secretion pathway protein I
MGDERGFTLLEMLIALAIATAMLGVLLPEAVNAIATARNAGLYETAVALARSHLAMLGRNMADAPPTSTGRDGPFAWRVQVKPEATASPGPGIVNWYLHSNEMRATLYDVRVIVSWEIDGHRRALRIETQRLGFAPPPSAQP